MRRLAPAVLAVGALALATGSARASTYDNTVEAANPLAYFNLDDSTATTTTSAVNGYTLGLQNGASVQSGAGPVINGSASPALVLANDFVGGSNPSGTGEYAGAGGADPLSGGVSDAGTILAWINLAALPSTDQRTFSIAGESAGGDDLDLQIDGDNTIRFYTEGGGNVAASTPLTQSDLGQWIFVAASFTANSDRSLYIDGVLSGSNVPGGHYDSGAPFYICQSNLFGGRYFDGSIADVALYNTDLTATQIGDIYNSAFLPEGSGAPEPSTWALGILGVAMAGGALRSRPRKGGAPAAA